MDAVTLERQGFALLPFGDSRPLDELRSAITAAFPCAPTRWHKRGASQEEHVLLVKRLTDVVAESGLVRALVASISPLRELLGPSVDVQRVPHVRVSRPRTESDFVDWHRDTFYGNTPYEMNLWFPVFPLADGAGLVLLPGSHLVPATGVRVEEEKDPFRATVVKGSAANQVGYTYSPKSDDTIRGMRTEDLFTAAPAVGSAVLFFGHMVHRAKNDSPDTRITIDVRVKAAHAPTGTRAGYYVPLWRGVVDACAEKQGTGEG